MPEITMADLTCKICDKVLKSKKSRQNHERAHTEIFNCDDCEKECTRLRDSKDHIRVHHTANIKNTQCMDCEQWFYANQMAKHKKKCNHQNFKCPVYRCPLAFQKMSVFDQHMADVHSKRHKIRCDKCTYTTYLQHSIKITKSENTKRKGYQKTPYW